MVNLRTKKMSSEKINSDKQPSETSPESSTSVPSPAGITEPVNEKARTVLPLAETVNPFAAASPPVEFKP